MENNVERVAKMESTIISMGKTLDEIKDAMKDELKYNREQREKILNNQEKIQKEITGLKVDLERQSTTIKTIGWVIGSIGVPLIIALAPVLIDFHTKPILSDQTNTA